MRRGLLLVALVAVAACGGGGSGGNGGPAPAPFGLDSRPSLAAITLPTSGSGGTYTATDAFPQLTAGSLLSQPMHAFGVPGANRIVVIQRSGQIKAFTNDPGVNTVKTILDISGIANFTTSGEQGLLGFAFDPNFTANRYFYIYYSLASPHESVVARFTWDAGTDTASLASQLVIITVAQPAFDNHKAGMIAFGPDGYLYIALGDGGSGGDPFGNGQSRSELLADILRIDVSNATLATPYTVPPDNPYVGDGDPTTLDEIWAYGLRNPFRFSFDRQTGDLWAGDVGQDAWEEVDVITKGGNYGWCVWEGNHPYCEANPSMAGFTFPQLEYDHSVGQAVIGGVIYRGSALPNLIGRYVFGDYETGHVWAWTPGTNFDANATIFDVNGPVAFGEDDNGEILIVSLNTNQLFKITDTSGGGSTPTSLADTGVFTNVANLTPASGLIEYDINLPFWSDGALKRRWIGVPNGQHITFSATGAWTFPVGTVIVKHFEMEMTDGDPASAKRLETRILTRQASGWAGFVYRWNDAQTDATLIADRETQVLNINASGGGVRQQTYEYPSRSDCLRCHNDAAGDVLGLKTRQVNRNFDFPNATDNELRTYDHIGLFAASIGSPSQYGAFPDINDAGVPVATRARGYLDVNCSQCHRPGGPTGVAIDLRFDTADDQTNTIGVAPQAGDLGLANAHIITAGSKESSVLWARMNALDATRMPPLASHRVDATGAALVGAWIDSL